MLPHWNKNEAKKWPLGKHLPPGDIGANFYPELGPYSSSDASVVNTHMKQIHSAGVGVLAVSWYPPGEADDDGIPLDNLMPLILDSAHAHGIKATGLISFFPEPLADLGHSTINFCSWTGQFCFFFNSNAYYTLQPDYQTELKGQNLPVFYIYDSYQVPSSEWAAVLKPGAPLTLRDTRYDGIFLGLYLSPEDEVKILDASFDGFYTYFAANEFTKGSSWTNWKTMAEFAKHNNLLFVPSIGPGYVDTRIRPWNAQTERKRDHGNYFRRAFEAAIDAGAKYISITSFNEWHEGTQVEPAIPKETERFKYEDYQPHQPDFYLNLLKTLVDQFSKAQK
ncbi:hypothetical protein C0Q70_11640 [Pomacea canaliculata]|uniref:Uncharacterized protein n=1 Tax=Pomacea canaliculata TaxID=400727 RepID=A0A2T7P6M1_POMCA|nr:hypothetical protein C0Q70_11640 [Pomacea canaliculata]